MQTQPAELNQASNRTYGQILKSSALVGGSSVLNIVLGIVRTKAMALLLGPSGIGLLGLYGSITDLARTVAGMGINSSGVRQIAEAVGTGDTRRIAVTVTTLRRVALLIGALGASLLLILSKPISRFSFGDDQHAGPVALLALALFFGEVSAGQIALVQGMRRIADLARASVLGAFYGTLFSIPIVYLYEERGVVPSLVCVAAMGILTSWWYSRRIKVERVKMSLGDIASVAGALLKLGVVFMASALMTMGVAYLVRIIVLRKVGVEAAGFYQAAWALGGIYAGFILQAMGADFYPRLTASANNNTECNRLVNEQAEVGLLMAGPGILGTLTFAPWVIQLFYSARFGPAVEILRWICLGMMLRVASWPMGFILVAKGARNAFFWTEFLGCVVNIGMVWVSVPSLGAKGTGIAFFGTYVFYWCAVYATVRRATGFQWTVANKRIGLMLVPSVVIVFGAWYILPHVVVTVLGAISTLLAGGYSLKKICVMVPSSRFPRSVRAGLEVLKIIPPDSKRCAHL